MNYDDLQKLKMNANEIKKMVNEIINDGSGMIYNDCGSGSAGPGYADSQTLQEMIDAGDFDDAVVVDFDDDLAKDSFMGLCDFDASTEWVQIEFNFGVNNYNQIGWIWNA